MKTEKQIRAKLKEIIKAYDEIQMTHGIKETYLVGVMEVLEWVLDEEEDE